LIPEVRYKNNL